MIDVGFKLKTPCADCPFRTDAPQHEGVAADLMKYANSIDDGHFIHSCHKTDSRADDAEAGSFARATSVGVQHCAGALIMLEKMDKRQVPAWIAYAKKKFKPEELDMKAAVFSSIAQLVIHYAPSLRKIFSMIEEPVARAQAEHELTKYVRRHER